MPWMRPAHAAIARTFEPADLRPLLDACGIDSTILVQAACTDADTDAMFEQADANAWIGAVTAWVDLTNPQRARARLDRLARRPKLRGIRHLIHEEDDPHWILREDVLESIALLEDRGLVLELVCVYPRHLGDVPELAQRFPDLTIVIDHLGKPPLLTARMADWTTLRPARSGARQRGREDLRSQHRPHLGRMDGERHARRRRGRGRVLRPRPSDVGKRLAVLPAERRLREGLARNGGDRHHGRRRRRRAPHTGRHPRPPLPARRHRHRQPPSSGEDADGRAD